MAASAGSAGAAPNLLVARFYALVKLSRAVRLGRDRRELSGAVLGERGVVLLEVFDQVKTRHAVVEVRAYRLACADGLGRIRKADTHFLQISEESLVVVVGRLIVDAW